MTVRIQVVIEADTMEAAVAEVRDWLAKQDAMPVRPQEPDSARRERDVRDVLAALKGPESRRLVRELAEAAMRGESIRRDATLLERYGKTNPTSFAGMVGGPNKLMRRFAGRDLIARDRALGEYRMDPLDAEIVVAVLSAHSEPTGGSGGPRGPARSGGIAVTQVVRAPGASIPSDGRRR